MTAALVAAPPCPDWCDEVCRECTCDSPNCRLLHTQKDTRVDGDGRDGKPNTLLFALDRRDTAGSPREVRIHLDLTEHDIHFTLAQAREIAAHLNRLADQGELR